MSNRKKKRYLRKTHPSSSSNFPFDQNRTIGPDDLYDEPILVDKDATTASNLVDDVDPIHYSSTTAGLTDKYFLSGKYDIPIWRLVFLLLAVAFIWIFIQDNNSGAFKQGDFWAIIWTIQKCVILFFFIFLLLLFHSFTNYLCKRIRKN